ncbi:MAG TPA: metallophosphoesterase [Candidatus Dormibacteraeota bacterium]|nr:metallophosphoesterase [Candidatus Dormibacteraeota bacterium]
MAAQPGESHTVRTELATGDATVKGEAIACIAHLTDLHVTDAQSPARFEFVNREARDPRFRELLTMQRPQEMLNTHAVAAMVRTLNEIESVELVAVTGDAVDNTQRNELANFLALLDGGTVHPDSGSPGYEGVQCTDWPEEIFWKPDGPADGDVFQRTLGFPQHRGLLEEAVQPFASTGLRAPWLRCYGNHEQLCQGVGVVNADLASAMAGTRKPVALPPDLDRNRAVEIFTRRPEEFMTGAARTVSADPERRPIHRTDLMRASYYVYDSGPLRYITLDTVRDAGGADGTVGLAQLEWLKQHLGEAPDRLVVLLSHHGSERLSDGDGLLALLKGFRNVVLWLNGHTHINRIRPRGTFWEVTTGSLVDWPCQARLVELHRTREGMLAIRCTMLDHDGAGLAGLHRELAGNVPAAGFDSRLPGTPSDRNAVLLLEPPF